MKKKKKVFKKPIKKSAPKKRFQKHDDNKKDWTAREEDKWEKDGLDEEEGTVAVDHIDVDAEDEWIEVEGCIEEEVDSKIIDEEFLEDEDKDNY